MANIYRTNGTLKGYTKGNSYYHSNGTYGGYKRGNNYGSIIFSM